MPLCCCAVCMVHSMCKEVSPLPPTQGSPSGLGKRRSLEFVWSLTEKKFGVCSEVSLSLGWKNQEAFETPLLRGVLALSLCVCVYVLCGCLVWLLCGCLVWLLVSFVCFVRVCVCGCPWGLPVLFPRWFQKCFQKWQECGQNLAKQDF